jgi:hypothetical protein
VAILAILGILGAIGWLLIAKNPIVDLDVFKDKNFAMGCVCIGATGECLGDGGAAKVPRDMTNANGWNYVGMGSNVVQVYGAWCDQIKASGADQVQIIYGCPKIDVRVN